MTDDLISRQAVKNKYKERIVNNLKDDSRGIDLSKYAEEPYKVFCEFMDSIPPATAEPKTGHWIEEIDDYGKVIGWHCDKCYEDSGFTTDCKSHFCPNCGARMFEPQESEEV